MLDFPTRLAVAAMVAGAILGSIAGAIEFIRSRRPDEPLLLCFWWGWLGISVGAAAAAPISGLLWGIAAVFC